MRRIRPTGAGVLLWVTGVAVLVAALVAFFVVRPGWSTALPITVAPTQSGARVPTVRSTPEPAPLHVVGLGDSVMAGTNCNCRTIMDGFAHAMADRTGREVTATNLGVPGYTTDDLLDQLQHENNARRAVANADIVIVVIGANDLGDAFDSWNEDDCDASCYQPQIDAMGLRLVTVLNLVRSLRDGRPMQVLVDDYWNVFTDGDVARADGGQEQIDWSSEVTRAANLAIAKAAGRTGGVRVDLVNAFRDARDGDATPLLTDDGDHPNAAGVRVIVAANLAAVRV